MRFHMINAKRWKIILASGLLWVTLSGWSKAQMNMDPYFSAISYPVEKNSLMLMGMSDFQSANHDKELTFFCPSQLG